MSSLLLVNEYSTAPRSCAFLLGVTAVEDKLSYKESVAETMHPARAGGRKNLGEAIL
jgi:hypothetical protein